MDAAANRPERDAELMRALLEWRRQTALKFEVPVFYILQEKTLRLIVDRKPLTLEGLLHIDGIAEVKLSYFGSELLEILERYLSPGERALKDYASAVPVKSCCHLCNLCDSVACPGCGVVHNNPHNNWSTTNSLLYQIKPGQKIENFSAAVGAPKRRKTDASGDFVMKTMSELHCPLNNVKRPESVAPVKKNDGRVDEKSVQIQNAFLRKMVEQEMAKEMQTSLSEERSTETAAALERERKGEGALSDAESGAREASEKSEFDVKGFVKNASSVEKEKLPKKKKRKRERAKKRKAETSPNDSSVLLDKSFWDMASKVKKRTKEALKKKKPTVKKPKAKKRSIPAWIGRQDTALTSARSSHTDGVPLYDEPPDLDTCPIPILKSFLNQNGFTCPFEIHDASELRALAKNCLSSWEVHRVLNCERLPLPGRHRAILRLKSSDDGARMRSNFRKLSLIVHPDKNTLPEAGHAFYLLQSAVQYLSAS